MYLVVALLVVHVPIALGLKHDFGLSDNVDRRNDDDGFPVKYVVSAGSKLMFGNRRRKNRRRSKEEGKHKSWDSHDSKRFEF
jgi:hypothetical protein